MNFTRFDRFLTLYCFRFVARVFRRQNSLQIPILMYHSISDTNENGVHPYYQTCTSPKIFAEQMRFLHDNNYSVISLSDAVDLLSVCNSITKPTTQPLNHSTTQRKFVVLTFDDGYRDFYTQAFPTLKRYGFMVTVFLPTAFIDNAAQGLRGKAHLAWTEIREIQTEGVTFGSHTINHPQLHQLSWDLVRDEISKSKEIIENKTGKKVEFFCYPYKFPEQDCKFVGLLRTLLQSSGYRACATTRIGCALPWENGFFLPRLPVNSGDDVNLLRAKMEGGYDWLGKIQYLTKVFVKLIAGSKHKQYLRVSNLVRKSNA